MNRLLVYPKALPKVEVLLGKVAALPQDRVSHDLYNLTIELAEDSIGLKYFKIMSIMEYII